MLIIAILFFVIAAVLLGAGGWGIIGALIFVFLGVLLIVVRSSIRKKSQITQNKKRQWLDFYSQFSTGTSLNDVVSIFGPGTIVNEITTNNNTTQKTVEWYLDKKTSISMIFEDNVLVSKKHRGLL